VCVSKASSCQAMQCDAMQRNAGRSTVGRGRGRSVRAHGERLQGMLPAPPAEASALLPGSCGCRGRCRTSTCWPPAHWSPARGEGGTEKGAHACRQDLSGTSTGRTKQHRQIAPQATGQDCQSQQIKDRRQKTKNSRQHPAVLGVCSQPAQRSHLTVPRTISAFRWSTRPAMNWLSMGTWCVSMPR
jgi:hypothetical protein